MSKAYWDKDIQKWVTYTQVTGSYVEYRISKADPMPTLIPEEKGATCYIIDTGETFMSTGTEWKVF